VRPLAEELNMAALPLVFHAGGVAELVAETAHLGDFITTHIIFPSFAII
jgi:hypothetical protein